MFEAYWGIFRKCHISDGFSQKDFEEALQYMETRIVHYPKHTVIVPEGSPARECGLVLEGFARLATVRKNGQRLLVEFIPEGRMFGDMLVLSSRPPVWPVAVEAKTDCTVLLIPSDFITGKKRAPQIDYTQLLHNLVQPICNRGQQTLSTLRCLQAKSVREKVIIYLLEQVYQQKSTKITLACNREELADLMVVSRPSLCRELSKMREEKLIDYYKYTFEILDLEALRKMI